MSGDLVLQVEVNEIVYGGAPAASLTYDGCEPQTLHVDAAPQAALAVEIQSPVLIAAAEQGPPGIQGSQGIPGPQGVQGPPGVIDPAFILDGGAF